MKLSQENNKRTNLTIHPLIVTDVLYHFIPLLNLKFLLTFLAFDCTIDKNKRRKDSYAKH